MQLNGGHLLKSSMLLVVFHSIRRFSYAWDSILQWESCCTKCLLVGVAVASAQHSKWEQCCTHFIWLYATMRKWADINDTKKRILGDLMSDIFVFLTVISAIGTINQYQHVIKVPIVLYRICVCHSITENSKGNRVLPTISLERTTQFTIQTCSTKGYASIYGMYIIIENVKKCKQLSFYLTSIKAYFLYSFRCFFFRGVETLENVL